MTAAQWRLRGIGVPEFNERLAASFLLARAGSCQKRPFRGMPISSSTVHCKTPGLPRFTSDGLLRPGLRCP